MRGVMYILAGIVARVTAYRIVKFGYRKLEEKYESRVHKSGCGCS